MKTESGRSLIENIGIMALSAIAIAGTLTTYNVIRNRQIRTMAVTEMQDIAKNTKLLLEMRGDYTGVSVDYLVKSGALKNNRAPIGGDLWSVTAGADGKEFLINLVELTGGECDYFATLPMPWVKSIRINGYQSDPGAYCLSTGNNEVSLIIE